MVNFRSTFIQLLLSSPIVLMGLHQIKSIGLERGPIRVEPEGRRASHAHDRQPTNQVQEYDLIWCDFISGRRLRLDARAGGCKKEWTKLASICPLYFDLLFTYRHSFQIYWARELHCCHSGSYSFNFIITIVARLTPICWSQSCLLPVNFLACLQFG